jgi:hypothetical protein
MISSSREWPRVFQLSIAWGQFRVHTTASRKVMVLERAITKSRIRYVVVVDEVWVYLVPRFL